MSSEAPPLEVLLACFEGHQQAAKVHGPLSEQVKAHGAEIWEIDSSHPTQGDTLVMRRSAVPVPCPIER